MGNTSPAGPCGCLQTVLQPQTHAKNNSCPFIPIRFIISLFFWSHLFSVQFYFPTTIWKNVSFSFYITLQLILICDVKCRNVSMLEINTIGILTDQTGWDTSGQPPHCKFILHLSYVLSCHRNTERNGCQAMMRGEARRRENLGQHLNFRNLTLPSCGISSEEEQMELSHRE